VNDKYRNLLEGSGLKRPNDTFANGFIADAFRYARSGRKDTKGGGTAAFLDDEYRARGYTTNSAHAVLMPGAAFLRHMAGRALQPYQTTVVGSGAELTENTLRPDLFIDALRPRSVVLSLGAQSVGGQKGDVVVPRQDTTSSAYWLTTAGTSPVTSGAITESEATFDASQLTVAPAQIGGFGTYSQKMEIQGGELFGEVIANDVGNVLATAIDTAAIQGSGSSGQPTGLTNIAGTNAVSGAAFSYATSVSAVQVPAAANALVNRQTCGWVTTPTIAGLLSQRQKASGYPSYILDGNVVSGTINNHRALSTNNVPAGTAIFGDFSQIIILSWGDASPIEIEVNPYSGNFPGGDVQFRALLSCNLIIRHPQSFSVLTGCT
jgi:HK97 family phage major capsid protein